MSPLLESLLNQIGDPNRPDLLQIGPPILERLRALPREEQLRLRREVTDIRQTLTRDDEAWIPRNIVFQFLWHLTGVPVPLSAEQKALRDEMKRVFRDRNGDWYAAETWLTAEEAAERMERRAAELLRENTHDAS